MGNASVIEARFTQKLKSIEVNGRIFLKSVERMKRKLPAMPAIMYMYRPSQPFFASTTPGPVRMSLGLETGDIEVTYSWVWELYIGIGAGEERTQELFRDFDEALGDAFNDDPTLGGEVPLGVGLAPRGDPTFYFEGDQKYLFVPMDFTATVTRGG